MEELTNLIFSLCAAPGLPGDERGAAAVIAEELSSLGLRAEIDAAGSVSARFGEAGARERVLLDAHLDQVGLLVVRAEESGLLAADRCGGTDRRVLPGAPVVVHGRRELPGFVLPAKEGEEKLLLDCGLTGEEAAALVAPGDRVSLWQRPAALLGSRISCAALDDRCGCAVLLRCAELIAGEELSCEVILQFSSLEEIGGQGAAAGAYRACPTQAIAVDVSFAAQPDVPPEKCGTLGGGPMIGMSPVLDSAMTRRLASLAGREGIPHTFEVMGGETSTDGDPIAVSRAGVRTALLSVPLRYMHTAAEVIDVRDVERTAQLLAEYLREVRA